MSPPIGFAARDMPWFDSFVPHPGRGITPIRMMQAFALAEQGYPAQQVELFNDLIEGDAHARNLFEHRDRVVANKPLVFDAGQLPETAEAANVLALAASRLPIKAAFEHLLHTNRHGYAGIELDWDLIEVTGRKWVVPTHLTLVSPRRFRIGTAGMRPVAGELEVRIDELRLYEEIATPQGNPLAPGKWLTILRQPTEVARGGLMRTGAPIMMAKRFSFRDWIVLSQRYGIPFPIIKYSDTNDQETLQVALEILRRFGSDGGAAVHKDLEIEVTDGVKVKDPMQDRLIEVCNNEMSKLVNGSTLRNDNTGAGSYGLGDVHDSVAWDEVRDDGEMLSEAINLQICRPFAIYNRMAAPPPVASVVVEPDLGPQAFVTLAVKMKNELGVDVSQSQLRQRTGLRKPVNAEDTAPGMQVESFPIPGGGNP